MKKKQVLILLCLVMTLMPVCSSLAAYRVNTSWLKAHEKPEYSAKVVDSYRRDFAVSIVKKLSGGWAKVKFLPSGRTAYVQSKYLASSKSYTAYVSKDNTNLRTGPSTTFTSKGQLNKGAKVTVLSHGSAFDYVSTSKGKGYIRNSCLTTKKTGNSKNSSRTAYIKNPAKRTVNLRKGPGTKYRVMAEYRPGTKVTLLKKGSAWSKVSVGGKTGYIMTKYLKLN